MARGALNSEKLLLILLVLNVILVIQENIAVEGIFFLDLLCATRIDKLERQVSALVARLNGSGSIPSSTTITSLIDMG